MPQDEQHWDDGELTTRPVVAVPLENRASTCGEATSAWSSANCETDYGTLSRSAGRCCGGGASYCPAPQLCADPAAFDPAAVYEHLCSAMISADFTNAMCSAAGCYSTEADESGTVYCSCQVTDSDACLAKLPGEPR